MSPARLLIVEDDDDLRTILAQRFSESGYEVVTAATGPAALEAVEADVPDLVMLDVMLPELDGVEVCRRLRAKHPLLYIMMLTARADELDRVVGLEVGADDYLTKPFSMRSWPGYGQRFGASGPRKREWPSQAIPTMRPSRSAS